MFGVTTGPLPKGEWAGVEHSWGLFLLLNGPWLPSCSVFHQHDLLSSWSVFFGPPPQTRAGWRGVEFPSVFDTREGDRFKKF